MNKLLPQPLAHLISTAFVVGVRLQLLNRDGRMTEIGRDRNLALVTGLEAYDNKLLSTLTEAWSDVTTTAKQLGRLTHILGSTNTGCMAEIC